MSLRTAGVFISRSRRPVREWRRQSFHTLAPSRPHALTPPYPHTPIPPLYPFRGEAVFGPFGACANRCFRWRARLRLFFGDAGHRAGKHRQPRFFLGDGISKRAVQACLVFGGRAGGHFPLGGGAGSGAALIRRQEGLMERLGHHRISRRGMTKPGKVGGLAVERIPHSHSLERFVQQNAAVKPEWG